LRIFLFLFGELSREHTRVAHCLAECLAEGRR
jgi:hypothetical protein